MITTGYNIENSPVTAEAGVGMTTPGAARDDGAGTSISGQMGD